MDRAGLERIRYTVLAGGIIAIHSGARPGLSAPPPPDPQPDEPQHRPASRHPGARRRAEPGCRGGWRRSSGGSAELVGGRRRAAGGGGRRDPGGGRQAPAARCWSWSARAPTRGDGGDRAPRPRSSSSTWRPWSTTTCSTPRRCAAAARPWSPAPGAPTATAVGDLLFSRAFAELADGEPGAERRVALLAGASVGPRPRRARPAPRRVRPRDLRRALPRALPAEDRAAVRVRLPDRRRRRARRRRRRCATFGREIGLAFQLLDDVLDVTGPPERTGKARGTDLLDGTVTLPLILARERDPALAELDLRALDAEAAAEAVCDRIAATGRARRGPRRRPRARRRGEGGARRRRARPGSARELLTMVADGVVERYS